MIALSGLSAPDAQEVATLTAPILAETGISSLRPAELRLDVQYGQIEIVLKEFAGGTFVQGRVVRVVYDSVGSRSSLGTTTTEADAGRTLLIQLNKANLSTISLEKRILNRLFADKHLAGSVTGTPQED